MVSAAAALIRTLTLPINRCSQILRLRMGSLGTDAPTVPGPAATPPAVDAAPAATPVVKKKKAKPRFTGKQMELLGPMLDTEIWPRPYYIEDGLRRLAPYNYTYNTCEFRDRPLPYYKAAMESGMILVNGKPAMPNHVLKNGDLVSHKIHRHEPPVTGEPIGIIYEDDDMIVINKPSGIPVHPAGRYNFNSVVEIMKEDRGRDWVAYPCNRLDRLTSGIMFVAKSATDAERLGAQIRDRSVRKEYIARVIGNFPDGEVVCDQPILQISPKLGLNRVRANGKEARTVFKKLAYYPPEVSSSEAKVDASQPSSGTEDNGESHGWTKKDTRFLGRDDPDAKENTDDDIVTRLNRMGKEEVADAVAYHDEMVDEYYKRKAEKMSGELCEVCDTPLYTDPGEQELCLWLHSLRYEDAGGAWKYVSPLPKWALPPAGTSGPTEVGSIDALVEAVKDDPEIA
ncbi:pseudouridine synthase [Apiospora hydei]|uniref:Pseudouridine synthase n=1 Tax=Apiospora hydei TaxID=1337664 RepID=A0ABR1WY85_9PEZI